MLAKKEPRKRKAPAKKCRAQIEAPPRKAPPRKPRYKPGVVPRRGRKSTIQLTQMQTAVLHILRTMDPEPQASWDIAKFLKLAESTCRYHLGNLVKKGLATVMKQDHRVFYLPT